MGGLDKGLQPFQGKPLVRHVLQRLAPQVGAIMVNANRNLGDYAALGVPVWPDELADYPGPLAGLAAGLAHCHTPYLASVPCDSPHFPTDLVARLAQALTGAAGRHRDRRHRRGWRTAAAAGVLPAAGEPAAQPAALCARRPTQGGALDRNAPLRQRDFRRRGRVLQCQHAGRPAAASALSPAQVFLEMVMVGNFDEKSFARCAMLTAMRRAIVLYSAAISPSGSATTVARPESACSRIDSVSGSAPR